MRSNNFEAKRQFLQKYGGIEFLIGLAVDDKNASMRLHKKVLFLLMDLLSNDDMIFAEN